MIGTKFYKNNFSQEEYMQAAEWCNLNGNYTIEDMGDHYEVVEIVTPLEELKEQKILELKYIRDNEELAPVLYNNSPFDFDQKSYERITAAIYALDVSGGDIAWTTADNNTMIVTANDLRGIIVQAAIRSNMLHTKYRQLRELVDSATSKEDLDSIVWR